MRFILPALLAVLLAACASSPTPPPAQAPALPGATAAQCPACPVCQQCPVPTQPGVPTPPPAPAFSAAAWDQVPGWQQDDLAQAWPVFLASCRALRLPEMVSAWTPVCDAARQLPANPSAREVRAFFQSRTQPWVVHNADGTTEGLLTGYYEPLIRGSRSKTARYSVPVYGVPDDLITVDLSSIYPELKNMRLRGRVEGRKLVPYGMRSDIEKRTDAKSILMWTDEPIDFFFLQVQGSGQVQMTDGSRVRLAYADQNGYPYQSIGRWLVQKGELKLEEASMQGIKGWATANPGRLNELLDANPSYVFFREEAATGTGPRGSQNVPLTAGRSIAVDITTVPLGTPVFLTAPMPDGPALQRLVLAQDTGGAIRGRVRGDYFVGFGPQAGATAGRMKQRVQMWALWPIGATPPEARK
ncbi:murein transglycosylase A [Uliginosibacterium sp. sgz301328]|uniref:murein transglycosylase A n=1 Tax=Uliginosibacterium sp. sgz301328 TaxID=3243764 RepID=UPI00359D8E1A